MKKPRKFTSFDNYGSGFGCRTKGGDDDAIILPEEENDEAFYEEDIEDYNEGEEAPKEIPKRN